MILDPAFKQAQRLFRPRPLFLRPHEVRHKVTVIVNKVVLRVYIIDPQFESSLAAMKYEALATMKYEAFAAMKYEALAVLVQ